jgi:hypothetical protein
MNLRQSHVTPSIYAPNKEADAMHDEERRFAAVALEVASLGANIGRLDRTVGQLIDMQIVNGRKLGELGTSVHSMRVEISAFLGGQRTQTRVMG